jgi:hypothetical protein
MQPSARKNVIFIDGFFHNHSPCGLRWGKPQWLGLPMAKIHSKTIVGLPVLLLCRIPNDGCHSERSLCHSERSEESPLQVRGHNRSEAYILSAAQMLRLRLSMTKESQMLRLAAQHDNSSNNLRQSTTIRYAE